jgi:hypothetical protein
METNLKKMEKTDLKKQDRKKRDLTSPMSLCFNPFLSYKYSYKSISSDGEKTHIKARENRFEDGKFESEEFQGTMDNNMYNQLVKEMNSYFSKQMELFFKPFFIFFKQ